jgi:inactivated superfamily I helicase
MESIPQDIIDAMEALANDPATIELVKHIESDPTPITQNNYDRYWKAIAFLSDGQKGMDMLVGLALIKAGANRQGVMSAIDAHHGPSF